MSVLGGSIDAMARGDRSSGRSLQAIVGRDRQFAELVEVLDEVIADGSRVVLVGGEAGVGKTTLVEVFGAALSGSLANRQAQLVQGQCVALGDEGLPYAPIVGAVRALLARYGRDQVLEWAGPSRQGLGAVLPELQPPAEPVDAVRLRLFEAVARLFEQAGARQPLVVVLEDIHWADESTRHLLRFLARALTDASVLLIATFRTDELTRRHPLRPFLAEVGRLPGTVRLDLPNLDRGEVAQLLSRLLGHPPSAAVVDLVHSRSEGIPYFVEELSQSASHGCVEMPDTLRDALSVRVQTLSETAQEVLSVVSVAGVRVDHAVLELVTTLPPAPLETALREAVDAAVLRTDENGYVFRHALLREVVHDDLLPGQHARLHARFAEVLQARPDLVDPKALATELAHHYAAAHETSKAFEWSIRAARSGTAAFHEALKMYERALELWDQVEDATAIAGPRGRVLELAAGAANDAGELERALALITLSLAETGSLERAERAERATRLMIRSRLLSQLLRPGAVAAAREAVAVLPADASLRTRGDVLNQLAIVLMLTGHRVEAVPVAEQAVAAAVAAGSQSLESNARNSRGSALVGLGREDEGLADLARAGELAHADTRTVLRYFVNYSDALHLLGRYSEAVEQALAGIDVARTLGLERSFGSMLAGNAAEPLLALGEWTRAERLIERGLELDPPIDHRAHLRLLRAWMYTWQDRLEDAERLLAEFRIMIVPDQPAPQYALGAIRADIEHALATGSDLQRAWGSVEQFLGQAAYYTGARYPVYACAAALAAVLDATDGADRRRRVRASFEAAEPGRVRASWEHVIVAELEDTEAAWRLAHLRSRNPGVPAHLAPYAGLRLARHLAGRHERSEVKSVLAEATTRAQAIGAGLLVHRLATLTQQLGLNPAGGEDARPFRDLTPRELEVLHLIAEGRSNGEIGTTLYISTKTASVHVSNILAKLGVSGRGEAAALAHRHGLVSV